MRTQSASGRFRIGQHTVELRAPRLSDADSWRRTCLEHEERLRPAFGDANADWVSEHSSTAWADKWWCARTDPFVVHSRVLIAGDGTDARMVGQVEHVGPDPRTGHVETSIWIAGVPKSSPSIAQWALATCVLDVLLMFPDVPRVIGPVYVHNRAAAALGESVGFEHVQTLRRLREYAGQPADHAIYAIENTAEVRAALASNVDGIAAVPLPRSRAAAPSLAATLGAARLGARKVRGRMRRSNPIDAPHALPGVARAAGDHTVEFHARRGGVYEAHVDGRPAGTAQVSVDVGTSTTEIIDRTSHELPAGTADAVVIAACRAAAQHQETRRLTIAAADPSPRVTDALATIGFRPEGATWPTRGDESTPRATWTRLRE
ncbi:GNAT family N-acetyltransferase [Tsukamurella ocularis]|uniref:GNAT family N-acetyltransferase n=1 Tax=Tsukamurella ocularis TaxID=1970234 RepID=UPI0021678800|nr:GNAT family N-acetyltransferase [Tsukamurella ocularis]MCS3780205.1 RimJ/RimL family protein N-acetyltransferase [Tsukamurella ocularis]MCS3786241.1 RimJ/RimL family protein N-acetyltransferase [Tsukamurella ocularis]MCS3849606.1 RimJ/RimL family protein N-acetyltransferase [Tsukamurella ocularis]